MGDPMLFYDSVFPYGWPLPTRRYEDELPAEFRDNFALDPWETLYYNDPFTPSNSPWLD